MRSLNWAHIFGMVVTAIGVVGIMLAVKRGRSLTEVFLSAAVFIVGVAIYFQEGDVLLIQSYFQERFNN